MWGVGPAYHERMAEMTASRESRLIGSSLDLRVLAAPLAFVLVALPYLIALLRILLTARGSIVLPDDLALIDLHTRRALNFRQQLGVFDHNGWSHPGPAYYYYQSVVYRLFGNRATSLFLGSCLLSGGSALCALWVVRRRSTPVRTLFVAGTLCWLGILLTEHSLAALTYSEGPLGALVSPWNPMVVILPLILLAVLVAASVDGSVLCALASTVVATFVVQANISSGPLALAMVLVGIFGGAAAVWRGDIRPLRWHTWALGAGLITLLVVMWIPPLMEEVSGHPGNLTMIWRFFTAGHPGQPLSAGLWTLVSVGASSVVGPSQVMGSLLGGRPPHAVIGIFVLLASMVFALISAGLGWRQRRWFAFGLGIVASIGMLALLLSVLHVVGFIFGYLAMWGVVVPFVSVLAIAMLKTPSIIRRPRAGRVARASIAVAAIACSVAFCFSAGSLPAASEASDPVVVRMAALVTPHLDRAQVVEVDDAGAGTKATQLLDTERFIGLVNELDRHGLQPRVNNFWKAQFGEQMLAGGAIRQKVILKTAVGDYASRKGFVGKAGDMAIYVRSSG